MNKEDKLQELLSMCRILYAGTSAGFDSDGAQQKWRLLSEDELDMELERAHVLMERKFG